MEGGAHSLRIAAVRCTQQARVMTASPTAITRPKQPTPSLTPPSDAATWFERARSEVRLAFLEDDWWMPGEICRPFWKMLEPRVKSGANDRGQAVIRWSELSCQCVVLDLGDVDGTTCLAD